MSELPNNWMTSTVGAVTEYIQRGKSPKYAETSELPVINQKCIRWNELQLQHLKYIHPDQVSAWDEARFIRSGDILWNSTGTGTVGRAYLVKEADCVPPKVVDSHVTIVRAAPGLESRYLFNWIKSPAVQNKIEDMCDGTTNQIELSRTAIAETTIPVAPREEQTRIADQLDTLLARIKACNDHLDAIPGLLKRFRQAVLSAATSGALTEGWRCSNSPGHAESELHDFLAMRATVEKKAPSSPDLRYWQKGKLPDGWVVASVHQVAECLDRLRVPIKKDDRESKKGLYPYYGANGEVGRIDKYIFDDELVLVTEDETFYGRVKPIAYRSSGKCWVNNHAHVLRAPTRAANDYLCFSLMYYNVFPWLTGTSGRSKLTQQALLSLPIALPPIAEITEIGQRVEALFKLADRIEARYVATVSQAQRLTPLTLAKAFRGELVEQDPNDEPASALLARLAAEREQTGATPKARKARTPRAERTLPSTSSPSKTMPNKSRQDEDVKGQPYLAAHLCRLGKPVDAKTLYEASELPVADFYKQLAWEIAEGHVNDAAPLLEPARHAA